LILTLAALGCQGPRPHVDGVRVRPSPVPGHYRIEAHIANRGRGRGEVSVRIRLRERNSGQIVHEDRDLDLAAREEVDLVADVPVVPGDWAATVDADYPQE